MFIQTQDTPNPATLKFIPGVPVMETGTADYPAADSATNSPLARRLFQIDGVRGVFLGGDFVAVTKEEALDWFALKPSILAGIMEHYASGMPVVESTGAADEDDGEEDDDIVCQIKQLLDTRVRPAVAMDGGDIVFQGFDDGVVTLQMRGACQGCPSSTATPRWASRTCSVIISWMCARFARRILRRRLYPVFFLPTIQRAIIQRDSCDSANRNCT